MSGLQIHPMTRLIVWLQLLVVVQFLNGSDLVVAGLLSPLVGLRALRRGGQLVWRTRWLLLSLLVVFSWGVAGEPLWSTAISPTREGALQALTHLGRLVLVLIAVAAFLEFLPLPDLLVATHALLRPLQRVGFSTDRGVVRLALVLRYVETLPRPRDWRSLLMSPAPGVSEVVEVDRRPKNWLDCALILLCGGLAIFLVYRGMAA